MTQIKNTPLASGEYYHVYCRGNNKQSIFINQEDRKRLLLNILLFQSTTSLPHFSRLTETFSGEGLEEIDEELLTQIEETRIIELLAFSFMPNHLHLILKQREEDGISSCMARILNSYTKYFNIRHERTGHVFQGRFGRVHIESNDQLLYLSTYIHRQCREVPRWKGREAEYPWSSYQDYIKERRWGKLLETSLILNQFKSPQEYVRFTSESMAKTRHSLPSSILTPSVWQ